MTRTKFAPRAAMGVLGALAIGALALPAFAATNDITGGKSNDSTGPLQHGDSVTYTVALANPSANAQNNLDVDDVMEPGLVYTPNSTVVTGELYSLGQVALDNLPVDPDGGAHTDYNLGTGWSGDWTEDNDDAAPATGSVQWNGGIDQNAIRLSGLAAAPVDPLDNPGIYRAISPAQLDGLIDAELNFVTNDNGVTGDDRLGVWVSTDGGSSWSAPTEFADGGADELRQLDLSPYLPTSSLMLRFGASAGDYATPAAAYWTIDDVDIDGIYGYMYGYDNAVGGYADLLDGTPGGLIIPADNLHLPAQVTFDSLTYSSWYEITYDATVDTSATVAWDTELENLVRWRSASYGGDDVNESASYVDVEYEPEIDVAVSSNGPVQTGQPIIITVAFTHGTGSDGSPVCVDDEETDVTFPAGFTAVNAVPTGGDDDLCLEEGETWTFTITYPGRPSAGTVPFSAELSGYTANAGDGDDFDITVTGSTDVVVVLADTGAANTGLAGVAAALVALGAAALAVARRRNA